MPDLLVPLIVPEPSAEGLEGGEGALGVGMAVGDSELFGVLVGDFPGVVVGKEHKEAALYPLILLL